eukprot:2127500-Rhodomonas_salina.1
MEGEPMPGTEGSDVHASAQLQRDFVMSPDNQGILLPGNSGDDSVLLPPDLGNRAIIEVADSEGDTCFEVTFADGDISTVLQTGACCERGDDNCCLNVATASPDEGGEERMCYPNNMLSGLQKEMRRNGDAGGAFLPTIYFCSAHASGFYIRYVDYPEGSTPLASRYIEVNCIYPDEQEAIADLNSGIYCWENCFPVWNPFLPPLMSAAADHAPAVYRWAMPTSSSAIQVPPSGMEVASVEFKTTCSQSGCWVIKGTLSTGQYLKDSNVFSTLYIPRGSPAPNWTYLPKDHPCTSVSFEASAANTDGVNTCCITDSSDGFL